MRCIIKEQAHWRAKSGAFFICWPNFINRLEEILPLSHAVPLLFALNRLRRPQPYVKNNRKMQTVEPSLGGDVHHTGGANYIFFQIILGCFLQIMSEI